MKALNPLSLATFIVAGITVYAPALFNALATGDVTGGVIVAGIGACPVIALVKGRKAFQG